jgi:hypothetical protein
MKSDSFDTPDRHADHDFDPNKPGELAEPSTEPAGAADAGAEGDEQGGSDLIQEYLDPDVQNRLWLKAIVPLLQLRSHETDPSGRVQLAFDLMYIAACERIARLLRSDLAASDE